MIFGWGVGRGGAMYPKEPQEGLEVPEGCRGGREAGVGGEWQMGPRQHLGNVSALISRHRHLYSQLQGWMAQSCASPPTLTITLLL